jgi:diacylglycerol kinase
MDALDLRAKKSDPGVVRKFKVFISGLRFAVLEDFNVTYKLIVSIIIMVVCAFVYRWVDFFVILVATGVALSAELFNSAIEKVCDFIQPNRDEEVRKIKDIAAAAASVGMLVWVVVIVSQLGHAIYFLLHRYGILAGAA